MRAFDGVVVGSIGFFGPPQDDHGVAETEIGYGLVPDARGHGAATEALRGMLLETDRLGVRVRAGVRPDNAPSLRVLAKCGFTELRGTDEDGRLLMGRPAAGRDEPAHGWSPPTSTARSSAPTAPSRRTPAT